MVFDTDRANGQRVRPARRSRWRLYAPGLVVTILSLAAIVARTRLTEMAAEFGLGTQASLTLAAGLVGALATLTAALCDRPPARWFIASALAVSLGANLAASAWLLAPLVLLGALAIGAREVERGFDGITLGIEGITLHRALKEAFTVPYDDVRAVHTSPAVGATGTLILETEHGTVTARDLPRIEDMQARIEARLAAEDVQDPEDAARHARKTIQSIVKSAGPA